MKRSLNVCWFLVLSATSSTLSAQVLNDFFGNHWLTLPGPGVGSFTIGNAAYPGGSALNVRGDQMFVPTGEVFRTQSWYNIAAPGTEVASHWRMYRTTAAGAARQMGEIYCVDHTAATNNFGFNIRQTQTSGSLWLRNWGGGGFNTNGLRLIDDFGSTSSFGAAVNRIGFVAIGFAAAMDGVVGAGMANPLPWSRLHLVHETGASQQYGFRPWMRNGLQITGNDDQMYVGHRYRGGVPGTADQSDAVIQWSEDGVLDANRQYLRFTFTTANTATGTAAGNDGLEIMRLWPESYNEGFVGIGDFLTAGLVPLDRLHVLNGDVRIGDLPLAANERPAFDHFVVVDPTTGELRWRYESASVPDCDWEVTAASDVVTAHLAAPSSGCPGEVDAVGIGTNTPTTKLAVNTDDFDTAVGVTSTRSTTDTKGITIIVSGGSSTNRGVDIIATQGTGSGTSNNHGVYVQATGNGGFRNYGFEANLSGSSSRTYGIVTRTTGATFEGNGGIFITNDAASFTHGAWGITTAGTNESYGVMGQNNADAALNCGVYGIVTNHNLSKFYAGVYGSAVVDTTTQSYAVYSNGDQYSTTGAAWLPSDAMLKTNVEEIQDGLDKILQLSPKRYDYLVDDFAYMHLPQGTQHGLLAQELEAVIPELVRDVATPTVFDTTGAVLHPSIDIKAIKYEGLIPLLIAAVKEQQVQIQALQAEIDGCCSGMAGGGQQQMAPMGGTDANSMANTSGNDALKIQPNPFGDATTISYTLAEGGSVRLIVSTSSGKQLQVLEDVLRSAGTYTYEWNTTSLASGIYNVMLLLDGAPMVQKAVKIAR